MVSLCGLGILSMSHGKVAFLDVIFSLGGFKLELTKFMDSFFGSVLSFILPAYVIV